MGVRTLCFIFPPSLAEEASAAPEPCNNPTTDWARRRNPPYFDFHLFDIIWLGGIMH